MTPIYKISCLFVTWFKKEVRETLVFVHQYLEDLKLLAELTGQLRNILMAVGEAPAGWLARPRTLVFA